MEAVTRTFTLLAHTSAAGTRRDEIEHGLRGFPVHKYIIYYRETEAHVVIARAVTVALPAMAAAFRVGPTVPPASTVARH